MTIERITKEKLDKIKDLIGDLDESARKNYGPGKFFTNETIVNGDKFNVLTALVKNLMVDAEKCKMLWICISISLQKSYLMKLSDLIQIERSYIYQKRSLPRK